MERKPYNDFNIAHSHVQGYEHQDELDEDVMVCECGETIPIKGINQHHGSCKSMKKKYSKLFLQIDKMITKEATSIQDWKNLKIMFKFLEGHVKMMITKEQKKPSHFKDSSPVAKHNYQDNSYRGDAEEEKIMADHRNPHYDYYDNLEEEKYEEAYMDRHEERQRCTICTKFITSEDEKAQNVAILECAHFCHKDCLKKKAKKEYLDTQEVKCKSCKDIVTTTFLNSEFGSEFINDLNEDLFRKNFIKDNPNMIECKCKNLLEVAPGSVDYKVKDDEGKVISKQAAEDMAKNRVRCNNCARIF